MNDFEEAKNMVLELLHKNGELDLIKTQLRTAVFTALSSAKQTESRPARSSQDADMVYIVKDFLLRRGLSQTAAVLDAEWGFSIMEGPSARSIPRSDPKQPLLASLLKDSQDPKPASALDSSKAELAKATALAPLKVTQIPPPPSSSPPAKTAPSLSVKLESIPVSSTDDGKTAAPLSTTETSNLIPKPADVPSLANHLANAAIPETSAVPSAVADASIIPAANLSLDIDKALVPSQPREHVDTPAGLPSV
ncbi:hypothetical protein HDU91_006938 [Kappamyces sp. JEL0680]|nr:hypothetical protein HDU91_006938 [Kappamyces sp. JEL0680]